MDLVHQNYYSMILLVIESSHYLVLCQFYILILVNVFLKFQDHLKFPRDLIHQYLNKWLLALDYNLKEILKILEESI